jgi:hypothetical protein
MDRACTTLGRRGIHMGFREKCRRKETTGMINIKMDLRDIGCVGTDWIHLAQDRDEWKALVNSVMNLRVP